MNFDANHLEMINFCAEMLEQSHVQAIHIEPWNWTKMTELTDLCVFVNIQSLNHGLTLSVPLGLA